MLRRSAIALVVSLVAASAAMATDGNGGAARDVIIDFDMAGRGASAYATRAAARPSAAPAPVTPATASAPAQVAQQAPSPALAGVPTSVEGYTVAPNSIEGYNAPQRREYADISAPLPLPPRFPSSQTALPPAPASASPYITPAARPAAAAAAPVRAKRAAAPKRTTDKANTEDAATEEAEKEDKGEAEKPETPHYVAVDVSTGMTTRRSLVSTAGVTAAVGGPLEKSGVRVHAEWQGLWSCCFGTPKDSPLPQGVQLSNAALVGYEIVGEKGTVAGYVGVDVQNTPNAVDGLPSHRSTRAGLQVSGDVYYTPTDKLMMSSNMSFSTNKLAYFVRTKFGVAIAEDMYVGPEFGAIGNRDARQYRAGAHISGVKLGALTFGFAAGYSHDRKKGDGAYAILDSRIVF